MGSQTLSDSIKLILNKTNLCRMGYCRLSRLMIDVRLKLGLDQNILRVRFWPKTTTTTTTKKKKIFFFCKNFPTFSSSSSSSSSQTYTRRFRFYKRPRNIFFKGSVVCYWFTVWLMVYDHCHTTYSVVTPGILWYQYTPSFIYGTLLCTLHTLLTQYVYNGTFVFSPRGLSRNPWIPYV